MKQRYYEITWDIKDAQVTLDEALSNHLAACFEKAGEAIDVRMCLKKAAEDQIIFSVEAEAELNLGKALRLLEKKAVKLGGSTIEKVLNTSKAPCIVSFPSDVAGKDGRIKRLIKEIRDVGYYDLHEFFSGDLEAFKVYLSDRKLGVIELGERIYLIDLENLKHKINLNCFECTKKHQYGCCCGSPCDMSRRNKERFDLYEEAMGKEVAALDPEGYKQIKQTGGFVFLDGSINECNGHCALLVYHEGSYKCMAHKYALENNMPIYEICPLSCLMYPLEIMTLMTDKEKRIMLITSVVEEEFANEYGRWGSYASLEVELRCINENAHDEVFKKEEYKPIYEVNRGLLIHELSQVVYEGIARLCK